MNTVSKAWALCEPTVRGRVLAFVASSLILSLLETLGVALVMPVLSIMVDYEQTRQSALDWGLPFELLPEGEIGAASVLGGLLASLFLVKNLGGVALLRWQVRFLTAAEARLSLRLYEQYMNGSLRRLKESNINELIRNVYTATTQVFTSYVQPALTVVSDVLAAVAIIALVVQVDHVLAAVAGATMLTGVLVLMRWSKKRLYKIGAGIQDESAAVLRKLREGLDLAREIRVLGVGPYFLQGYANSRERLGTLRGDQAFINYLPRHVLEILLVLGCAILVVVVSLRVEFKFVLPLLGLYVTAGLRLMPAVARVLVGLQNMRVGNAAVGIVYDELVRRADRYLALGGVKLTPVEQRQLQESPIEFRQLTVSYPNNSRVALDGLSMVIPRNSIIGIVGGSGAGKSTLVDTMMLLEEPAAGACFIGGRDVREWGQNWQSRIGYVPQDVALIDDTLEANIALGIPAGAINHERLAWAVQMACLDEVVAELPDGLQSRVGERGRSLSGGQRQRVGLARALYASRDVLVLDEASSALDNRTEMHLIEALHRLRGKVTIIIVAHRLSTVRSCDAILHLENGKKIAMAPFDQLIGLSPIFRQYVEHGMLGPLPVAGGGHE